MVEFLVRYNYELMEDEYHESLKRRKAFNAKINQMQRAGSFFTNAQVVINIVINIVSYFNDEV